jgi:hypothetical protein
MNFKSLSEVSDSLSAQGAPFSTPSSIPESPEMMAGPVPMPVPTTEPANDEPSLIADLALAPVRGVLNATEEVADLVSFGNVPEGSLNRLGRSKTTAGGFVENATQFLVGFTPGFGWLNRISKLGKLAKLGKVGQFVAKSNVAKGAIAGAVADFSVFDEHQARLSDLIESVPELQNPITEYLASDQDDSMFEGRMKSAVEGVLAGGVIDGIISGVKALRGAKKAVEIGNIEQANKLLLEAEDPALRALTDEYPEDLAKADADLIAKANADEDAIVSMPGTDGRGNAYMTADEMGIPEIKAPVKKQEDLFEEAVPMPEIGPDGKIYDREMKMSEFMGTLPKTQKMVEILNKSDADIASIRQELLGDASRPILNIFNHSGPAGAHKSVTAFVKVSKEELENYRADNPKQNEVLSEAVEDIKRNGGEKWLNDTLSQVKDARELPLLVLKMRVAQMDVMSQLGALSDDFLKTARQMEAGSADPFVKDQINAEYVGKFIRLNEFVPNVTKILFGNKELGTSIGRALAFRKQTKREAQLAEELIGRAEKWAKDPSKMKEYGKVIAEELGQGDAKEGIRLFNEGIERFATLFEKYGERGLVTMAPDKFWIKLHNEWWINALLSGPRTFGVNMIGNTISTMWKPFESAVGAQVAYIKTGNPVFKQIRNSFWSQYGMMFDTAREALVMANRAFKTGESGLVQNKTAVEQFEQIITKENFEAKLKEIEQKHPNTSPLVKGIAKFLVTDATTKAGDLIRLPTKALLWMDEFTKQLNFRSSAKARAISEGYDQAWDLVSKGELETEGIDAFVAKYADDTINSLVLEGGGLYALPAVRRKGALEGRRLGKTGLDLEDYIESYVAKNFDETKSNLAQYAYGWAEEVTFTKRGAEKTIQRSVEKFVKDHPSMRLILPFVTTPTNIIKFFGQRAFGLSGFVEGAIKNLDETSPELSKAYLQITRELYSPDPFLRAQAEGKIAMGLSVLGTAIGLHSAGMITGQGARDEKERALKQATGWQPYSFRIKIPGTDKYQYISYQRFDPLATFFGIVADFADKATEDPAGSRDSVNFIASAIGVALSKNITSKSYLTGIEQVMDAINQPDRKMSQFLGTRLGSLVVPSVVGQTIPMGDPIMREARTLMDNVLKRVPGVSQRLDPKRNILGEEIKRPEAVGPDYISPLFVSTEKKDKVMDELANLKYSFSLPPVVEKGGIDLYSYKNASGQSAYDRYLELTGKVTIGRKTLREALAKVINTRSYQALPADAVEGLDSPRIAELRRVISKYRATAKEQVYREFPELDRDSNLRGKLKLARQQGKVLEAQGILGQLKGDTL